MPVFYNRKKAKALSERQRKRALHRWALDKAERDRMEPERLRAIAEAEALNYPLKPGDVRYSIVVTDRLTGRCYRWGAVNAERKGQYHLRTPDGRQSKPHGLTWIFDEIRSLVARGFIPKRLTFNRSSKQPNEALRAGGIFCKP